MNTSISPLLEEFVMLWESMHPDPVLPGGCKMSIADMKRRADAQISRDEQAEAFALSFYGAALDGASIVLREPNPDAARFSRQHFHALHQRIVAHRDVFAYSCMEHNAKRFFVANETQKILPE